MRSANLPKTLEKHSAKLLVISMVISVLSSLLTLGGGQCHRVSRGLESEFQI